jgi:farnesyl-diphosphate farnesyltransferase
MHGHYCGLEGLRQERLEIFNGPSLRDTLASDCLMSVNGRIQWTILHGVSRSFYLSLRLLPKPMREAASLAYLLARTSDTLADAAQAPLELRRSALGEFSKSVQHEEASPTWDRDLLKHIDDDREKILLDQASAILDGYQSLPVNQKQLVRDVVAIIIGGQQLDLDRFEHAAVGHPVVIGGRAELDDYTWRVAGCVGEFWTRLGYETMAEKFSKRLPDQMIQSAIAYGKGLQLVNILRDLPRDLTDGRCYLPVEDPSDRDRLMAMHREYVDIALDMVGSGLDYAAGLRSRRLRVASVLPAMIANDTLVKLKNATWDDLVRGVKIPRSRVYSAMIRAFIS